MAIEISIDADVVTDRESMVATVKALRKSIRDRQQRAPVPANAELVSLCTEDEDEDEHPVQKRRKAAQQMSSKRVPMPGEARSDEARIQQLL